MNLAPQDVRTFFISSKTAASFPLFRKSEFAELFITVLFDNRDKGRMKVHEFVVMHDHFHVILTPAHEHSLEKCVQFLKGGYSFQVKKKLNFERDIWQQGFNEHRIKDSNDYVSHRDYTHMNPVRAGYVKVSTEYPFSSANGRFLLDPRPKQFQG
jgi:putative transposase